MIDIKDRATLKTWLADRAQPDELIIASRIACRKLPRLVSAIVGTESSTTRDNVLLPVFRSIAATMNCATFEDFRVEISPRLSQIADGADRAYASCAAIDAANTDSLTAFSVGAADAASSACEAVKVAGGSYGAAHYAAAAEIEDAWRAVRHDALLIEQGEQASQFDKRCLWPNPVGLHGMPDELLTKWHQLREYLANADEGWEVWTDWYQDRLDGKVLNKDHELKKALLPESIWKLGAAKVNEEVARMAPSMSSIGSSDHPTKASPDTLKNPFSDERKEDTRSHAQEYTRQVVLKNPVVIGLQIFDLHDRIAQEIYVRKQERRNDALSVQNIAFLEGIEASLDELALASSELATNPKRVDADTLARQAWTVRDQIEKYSGWIAGDENARAIANGVLVSGMAGMLIQVVGMSALPVTILAVTTMAGDKFNGRVADFIKRMKGG